LGNCGECAQAGGFDGGASVELVTLRLGWAQRTGMKRPRITCNSETGRGEELRETLRKLAVFR
jgi:hypothetical protein